MLKNELQIIQTTILLLDGVSEAEILLKDELGPYLKKAKKIVEIIKEKSK